MRAPGPVTYRRILVTRRDVLGKTVGELGPRHLHGVVVTRITRADLEMTAVPDLRLQFGDVVHVVGEQEGIRKSAEILGNSLGALNETHFVPVFAGIVLGIALGTLPIPIPGLPQPLRFFMRGTGTGEVKSPESLSMVMFEPSFIRQAIELGEQDGDTRQDEIAAFLSGELVPGMQATGCWRVG